MANQIPQHFMRFGIHSEKKFFYPPPLRESYGGVALNGNLVAYSTKGVCSFMSNLLRDKPYFIDPITHAFGHHPQYISQQHESGKLVPKAAIKALSQQFGEPTATYVGQRSLSPKDFEGEIAKDFTKRVLDFQKHSIDQGLQETEDAKYLDVSARTPCFLIAPYFYMSSNSIDIWIDLNLKFIDYAVDSGYELPIFSEILVSEDVFFDADLRKLLTTKYADSPADGVLLWIEGFGERSGSDKALKGYSLFVEKLAESGKTIVVMYGGYFSIILRKFGVHAVCHGPGYGEEREVTPVGGGIPRPKFYFPFMHARLPYREVAFALTSAEINTANAFYKDVCNCLTCQEVIGDDIRNFTVYGESESRIRKDGIAFEYSTSRAKTFSTAHYIYNKKNEFDFVDRNNIQDIIQDLENSHAYCQNLFGENEAAHLRAWFMALKG